MNSTKRRHLTSWILLAIFVPMLLFSSLHVHEEGVPLTLTECTDCAHHVCHGHLIQTSLLTHDCVLCQFLSLTMLAAAVVAVTVYSHVCKEYHALSLCGYHAACCGTIVTRGPPSLRFS